MELNLTKMAELNNDLGHIAEVTLRILGQAEDKKGEKLAYEFFLIAIRGKSLEELKQLVDYMESTNGEYIEISSVEDEDEETENQRFIENAFDINLYELLETLAWNSDNLGIANISQVKLAELNCRSRRTIQRMINRLKNITLPDGNPVITTDIKNGISSMFLLHQDVLKHFK